METFAQIMEKIKNYNKAIKNLEEKKSATTDEWMKIPDLIERHQEFNKFKNELLSIDSLMTTTKLGKALLDNNARVALFYEVVPVVLDVLKKYKGKPYGEKTRAKICQEVVDVTGCRAYINSEYNQECINIYPPCFGNQYNIAAGIKRNTETNEQPRLLIDNKIQIVPFDNFRIWYIKNEYIENIPNAITEMIELHSQALAIQDQLKEVCSQFNRYAVDGINCIYHNKDISKYIV